MLCVYVCMCVFFLLSIFEVGDTRGSGSAAIQFSYWLTDYLLTILILVSIQWIAKGSSNEQATVFKCQFRRISELEIYFSSVSSYWCDYKYIIFVQ